MDAVVGQESGGLEGPGGVDSWNWGEPRWRGDSGAPTGLRGELQAN